MPTKISMKKYIHYFSIYFIKKFGNYDNITTDKTSNIFLYYLKLIFGFVKDEINRYQKS